MSKCENFLKFFDELIDACHLTKQDIPVEVLEFYDMLKSSQTNFSDKPTFTESGIEILKYLQSCESTALKAKDIGEGMNCSSRVVSGAIRKLVNDGYVEKFGQNPVIYALTEKGKNTIINNKENL